MEHVHVRGQEETKKNKMRQRRGKRDKEPLVGVGDGDGDVSVVTMTNKTTQKRQSRSLQKHKNDAPSGGMEALLPSLIGVVILCCGVMAKMGFRGRATVAGIDLGTTNSVICVQQQNAQLTIDCVPDPKTGSPIVPSVVSFLEPSERKVGPSSKIASLLNPHPSHVVVGAAAKRRIDSHPHHTLYNAKRVLGRPSSDAAVIQLRTEVEFGVLTDANQNVFFKVPDTDVPIFPQQVGSYVVHHLKQITQQFLGHDNVKSAVICVPAKFNALQRQQTVEAFKQAGISVARILEEPTAAALAYGLHRKEGVDYILVYDFGGGTLDVSLLHVSEGFCDVMGSDGDDLLGGTDFDVAIAHYLQEHKGGNAILKAVHTALRQLEEKLLTDQHTDLEDVLSSSCTVLDVKPLCTVSSFHTIGEQLKIGLSNAYTEAEDAVMSSECLGLTETSEEWTLDSFCSALKPITLSLTAKEYRQVAQPLFDRSTLPATRLMKDLDLTQADIDEVVMVGGTTRMPQIRQLIRDAFSESQLNIHIDPDITVAYGAASVVD